MECQQIMKTRAFQILTVISILLTATVAVLATFTGLLIQDGPCSIGFPPINFTSTKEVTYNELEIMMKKNWPQLDRNTIPFSGSDECYLLYSLADFKNFSDWMDSIYSYSATATDFNDCDDRAIIAFGREREWFTSHSTDSLCGSSFGLIAGWLNYLPNENCSEWRGHMMNIFVDDKLDVYGYDLGNRQLYSVSKDWCNNTYITTIFI